VRINGILATELKHRRIKQPCTGKEKTMLNRLTKKTGFYAIGGGVVAAIAEGITEFVHLDVMDEAAGSAWQPITDVALWMGLCALGISLGLLAAQNLYLKRMPRAETLIKSLVIGLVSGAIAGGIAQLLFGVFVGQLDFVFARIFQASCWGLAGLGVGLGVSFFVPNYPAGRATLAGFLGGALGGAAFVSLGIFLDIPEAAARVVGLFLLGAAIGLAISATEEILREAWLTVIWGKNETSSLSLGKKPVVLGSAREADLHLSSKKFPPITAILSVENNRVMLDNRLNQQKTALPNGSKITIGPITIVINARKGNKPGGGEK
jgi:MFS family permease